MPDSQTCLKIATAWIDLAVKKGVKGLHDEASRHYAMASEYFDQGGYLSEATDARRMMAEARSKAGLDIPGVTT